MKIPSTTLPPESPASPLAFEQVAARRGGTAQGVTPRVQEPLARQDVSPPAPNPESPISKPGAVCSVCHSPISPGEPATICPECGLPYHQQCWTENHGCSAYGCTGAGMAAPQTPQAAPADIEPSPATFPWEYILLAAAAAAIPVGALIFGVPGLLLALFAALRLKRAPRRGVVALSLIISIIALILGIVISFFWWYGVTL